jgi:hypothetical protein
MSEPSQLNRVFQIIMKCMMKTGQTAYYTAITSKLDVQVEERRKTLHGLFSPQFPVWLFPNPINMKRIFLIGIKSDFSAEFCAP